MRAFYLALFTAAACTQSQQATGDFSRETASIYGGADSSVASVYAVITKTVGDDSLNICSGVLIAPSTILTAAHCLAAVGNVELVDVSPLGDASGIDFGGPNTIRVTKRLIHPSYRPQVIGEYDFALLKLATPQQVAPVAVNRLQGSVSVGNGVLAVGYGRTAPSKDDPLVRRQLNASISSVAGLFFNFGGGNSGLCVGDSGGPSFVVAQDSTRHVAGIHSAVTSQSGCGEAVDSRVDKALSFIDTWLAAEEPAACAEDGRCVANCSDPDCICGADNACNTSCAASGRKDPDCKGSTGTSCQVAGECETGLCRGMYNGQYCTQTCSGTSCPAGFECLAANGGYCSRIPGIGETCLVQREACGTGVCVIPKGQSNRICMARCPDLQVQKCPDGQRCLGDSDSIGFCPGPPAGSGGSSGNGGTPGTGGSPSGGGGAASTGGNGAGGQVATGGTAGEGGAGQSDSGGCNQPSGGALIGIVAMAWRRRQTRRPAPSPTWKH